MFEEIKVGSYKLYIDGKGCELVFDLLFVYNNVNGNYKGKKNYFFMFFVYNVNGEMILMVFFNLMFYEGVEFFGIEEYWFIIDILSGQLNGVIGNVIVNEEDLLIDGCGLGFGLLRIYNSFDIFDYLFG